MHGALKLRRELRRWGARAAPSEDAGASVVSLCHVQDFKWIDIQQRYVQADVHRA
jgi:hypothetical protein